MGDEEKRKNRKEENKKGRKEREKYQSGAGLIGGYRRVQNVERIKHVKSNERISNERKKTTQQRITQVRSKSIRDREEGTKAKKKNGKLQKSNLFVKAIIEKR
jgi:hypothetical protein